MCLCAYLWFGPQALALAGSSAWSLTLAGPS